MSNEPKLKLVTEIEGRKVRVFASLTKKPGVISISRTCHFVEGVGYVRHWGDEEVALPDTDYFFRISDLQRLGVDVIDLAAYYGAIKPLA